MSQEPPARRGATDDRAYYNEAYYDHYNGLGPYTRERWLHFFRQVADGIVADAAPRTAIEFGCAKGFLVEALRERGVDARGVDFSSYAVAAAHEGVRPYLRVGDVREPAGRRYDVAVCLEVLEHLDARDAAAAVRAIAAAADTVYFSSNPDEDFPEQTHANVRPAAYWEDLFARAGLARDRDFDGRFIADWALKFTREPPDPTGPVDIIVPVHNSPKHLRWCVEALDRHTDPARCHLWLVDDASDDYTKHLLAELAAARPNGTILTNETNQGYVRSVNRALAAGRAPYAVLLNSDVVVTAGWLDRLLAAAASDPAIGLACPLSNQGENLTVAMPPGYSFADTAALIAARGGRRRPDAATVVGYCLLIARRLLDLIGPFDPIFGDGYVEEADYQFRAAAAGFRAVVVDDCYVYHARGASFGDRAPRELRNWPVFEARWGARYRAALARFDAADPLGPLRDPATRAPHDPPELTYDLVYYLPPTGAGVGGMISVAELVNRLILGGRRATVATVGPWRLDCECLFAPLLYEDEAEFLAFPPRARVLVATGHQTVEPVLRVCRAYGSIPAYFIQDYEGYFANGANLAAVAKTYERIPHRIAVSRWVHDLLARQHDLDSQIIPLGVAIDEFYPRPADLPGLAAARAAGRFLVFAMLRDDDRRGAPFLLEAARRLHRQGAPVTFVFAGRYAAGEGGGAHPLPDLPNVVGVGLLDRAAMARGLAACDAAVDASLYQGFGMLGIEALASGTPAVLTRTGGAIEYAAHEENCLLVAPRDVRGLCDALLRLRDDPALATRLAAAGRRTATRFDWADLAARHAAFLIPLGAGASLDAVRPPAYGRRPSATAPPATPPPTVSAERATPAGPAPAAAVPVYRGLRDGAHLYATAADELARAGYASEGVAFGLYPDPAPDRLPLGRRHHPRSGDHLLTTDPREGLRAGYRDEGILGHLATAARPDTRPLGRWRHPRSGDRLYTTDPTEGSRAGYRLEGVIGHVPPPPAGLPEAPPRAPDTSRVGPATSVRLRRLARAAYRLARAARWRMRP